MPVLDLYRGLNKMASSDEILDTNQLANSYGLTLDEQGALEILKARNRALRDHGRIELSVDPIKNIIKIFCTSPYIHQHNYVEVLNELIDIFYFCKNEIEELMSDQELISQMKEYFDKSCGGSLELLKNRELMILIRDIREQSLVEHNEEKERKCWDGPKIY
ncbi:MAG: DUF6323 family protein [Syntrophomonadaceae bacterium]|jgi:predicted AlkP superfamily pyrophosphatase or phosphodiesterase|nr:hypothetical protein [Syntrophomonadaceae bacterium]